MKRVIIWLAVIMLGFSIQMSFAYAANVRFTTQELDPATVDTRDICLLTTEPPKTAITCFDVSENGMFAIGTGASSHKMICVYNQEGAFQYGYQFITPGSYGVNLEDGVVHIYFARDDIAISLDTSGKVIGAFKVEDTSENNTRWRQLLYSNERTIGDAKYTVENDTMLFNLFTSSYSKLVVEKSNGTRVVVYNAGNTHVVRGIFIFVGAVLFVVVCVIFLVRTVTQRKQNSLKDGSQS